MKTPNGFKAVTASAVRLSLGVTMGLSLGLTITLTTALATLPSVASAQTQTQTQTQADGFDSTRSKIEMAMQGATRTPAETARDEIERRPVETLEFFGLRDNMRVLELVPGAGWYTKILAPTLRGSGKLYVAIGTDTVVERVLDQPGFDEVEVLSLPDGMTLRDLAPLELDFIAGIVTEASDPNDVYDMWPDLYYAYDKANFKTNLGNLLKKHENKTELAQFDADAFVSDREICSFPIYDGRGDKQ
jgi:hypothetical protein